MSSSLVGSPIPPEPLRSKPYKKASRNMATCIENPRTETTITPNFRDSEQPQIDNSLHRLFKFTRPNLPGFVSEKPTSSSPQISDFEHDLWLKMRDEAKTDSEKEPILANYYFSTILSQNSLEHALSSLLGNKLSNPNLRSSILTDLLLGIFTGDSEIKTAIRDDLRAVKERDPACITLMQCLLHFKGFQACQAHRAAHSLWNKGRTGLALLIQSRVSEVFAVDIHPGAKIGKGILFDHGTGVVIGETAVIGNNVSILHNVTLGGTGKVSGDRHPKIGDGVLVGAGTHVLGNVRIGEGAKIGAGSVVLKEVPARTTAVGNPARLVGGKENPIKLNKAPSFTMDHTSFITEWSDYVI